ncbi:hypothetical protein [Metabacillus indicus]|uniref:Uncharacterized protein n=1 Tax=Metabacillus indicus TaxID=246786 RepID=A0A084GW97_METID|nr:hypothetical protein [Metabacillus indicus]KEZ51609.1 hypothetical protein GS18_0210785 [Metabacillus indicus]
MKHFFLGFLISGFGSFILIVLGLFLFAEFYPIEDPSQGDGIGFAVAFGFLFSIPVAAMIGIVGGVLTYGFKEYKKN